MRIEKQATKFVATHATPCLVPSERGKRFRLLQAGEGLPRECTLLADRRKGADGRWAGGYEISIDRAVMSVDGRWAEDMRFRPDGLYRLSRRGIAPIGSASYQEKEHKRSPARATA